MRKSLRALVVVTGALFAVAPAAASALPKPVVVQPAPAPGTTSALVTNPRADFAVWKRTPTELVVRTDAGVERVLTVPEDCSPTALTSGLVAFSCSAGTYPQPNGFLALPSGAFVRHALDVPFPTSNVSVLAAGRHWLYVRQYAPIVQPEYLVDRATGEAVASDPFGARRVIDLDARSGSRPLCRKLRRDRLNPYKAGATWHPARSIGRYALISGMGGTKLHDCRTGKVRKAAFEAALNRRYSASASGYIDPRATITRLRPRRQTTLPGYAAVALSRGSAWLTRADSSISVVRLP